MSEVTVPATPEGDLADFKAAGEQSRQGILTPDLVALAQGGVSVLLASCREDGRPISGVALGARVDRHGTIRVLLPRRTNLRVLEALAEGRGIAVTFSRALDHRSFQVKASGARILAACPDDAPEVARQCAVFHDELIGIGLPEQVADGYMRYDPDDLVAIEFVPEEAFVQTPGPGAGSPLSP